MCKFILTEHKANIVAFSNRVELNSTMLNYNGTLKDLRDDKGHGFILLGDCINPESLPKWESLTADNEPKGNYYIFHVSADKVAVKSSGFGMLPVFYNQEENIVASNVQLLADQCQRVQKFNKKWLVNQLLFNYQFGDETVYQQIKLLPAFTFLTIENSSLVLSKKTEISDYFVDKPIKWQKQLKALSNKFIEICKHYFPNEEFTISFTGGFDGRTLVSIATFLKKSFKTFSYGRRSNDDVVIPQKNAANLNITYTWVPLEQEYAEKYYAQSALDFIHLTNGGNGFLYAHVNYSAKEINKHTKYMISGVAGSELFRALHISGAVTSPALIKLFNTDSFEEFRVYLHNSSVFDYLDLKNYASAIEEVSVECWKYKANLPKHLTLNQKLYVFVFEEIFRKFFGSWLLAQSNNIIVRTPFLDFEFFRELLKTNLAGVYSEFMTENPLKRFKGQVFYSEVIRCTSKKIFWQKTGKGYPPAFVRYAFLRPLLLIPFLLKRFRRNVKKPNLDNLAIISGVKSNQYELKRIDKENIDSSNLLQDTEMLKSNTNEIKRDSILMMHSTLKYLEQIKN